MEENTNIIERLERLESKEEIRDLVSKYAEACDQQDLESLESSLLKTLNLILLAECLKARADKI